jgi:hypothetical protein
LKILGSVGVLAFGSVVVGQHFWRGEVMSVSKVEKKWGSSPFDADKFRTGSMDVKAKMAASLIKGKKYIGKSVLDIRSELGDPDGYYFSDVYPAYIIEEGQTRDQDTWQIVFLLDKSRRITDVIVHKNCCD